MRKFRIIAAQPGWAVMEPYWKGTKIHAIVPEPVLAWKVVGVVEEGSKEWRARAPHPITVDGQVQDPTRIVLRRPDGTFVAPGLQDISEEGLEPYLQALQGSKRPKRRKTRR